MPESEPPVQLTGLAGAFGLPRLHPVEHHPGSSGVWRLRAEDRAEYALSCRPAGAPAYVLNELATAGDLERAAAAADIPIVRYLEPVRTNVGLAALVDDQLAVLHEWVPASRNAPPAVPPTWLGRTVAALHRLRVDPPDDRAELLRAYGVHPTAHWRQWLTEAKEVRLPWSEALEATMPAIAEATKLSRAALALPLPRCVTHRDLNPPNILRGPCGPLLCDFGYAGLDVAWLEAVDAALACTSAPDDALEQYLRAGGRPGPRHHVALARTTGATLMWLAYSMWLSLGHRDVAPARREQASESIPGILAGLVADLDGLDRTASSVFG